MKILFKNILHVQLKRNNIYLWEKQDPTYFLIWHHSILVLTQFYEFFS